MAILKDSRDCASALSRYPVSLTHTRSFLILYSTVNLLIFLLFSKDDRSRSLNLCYTTFITIVSLNKSCSPTLDHFKMVNVLA